MTHNIGWLLYVALGAILLGAGAWSMIRYVRTRNRMNLAAGTLLTLRLGLLFLLLLVGTLSACIVYAPPVSPTPTLTPTPTPTPTPPVMIYAPPPPTLGP